MPKRILIPLAALVLLVGCSGRAGAPIPEPAPRPSLSATESVAFLGREYLRQEAGGSRVVPAYQYFLPGEAPGRWRELVSFRLFPPAAGADGPLEQAQRTADLFRQEFPHARVNLRQLEDGSVLQDFVAPPAPERPHFEFSAMRYYDDQGSERVISLHYVRNVEGVGPGRGEAQVAAELLELRERVLPELMQFPLYRQ